MQLRLQVLHRDKVTSYKLQVFDRDKFSRDDALGEAKVVLEPLLHKDELEVVERLSTQGHVQLKLSGVTCDL